MKKYLLIVILAGCLSFDFVFGNNEIYFSDEKDGKKSKVLDDKVVNYFQSHHKNEFKNAIKFNLISYILIAPSMIKVHEPLVFTLSLFPKILDGLSLKKLKKDLNFSKENSINSNLKSIRNSYKRSFTVANLLTNFTAYFILTGLRVG
tara:strand:- start:2251 stop:2694 length:444 start_codon:yes stop_codon:yes gene_type:complete